MQQFSILSSIITVRGTVGSLMVWKARHFPVTNGTPLFLRTAIANPETSVFLRAFAPEPMGTANNFAANHSCWSILHRLRCAHKSNHP